MRDYAKASPRFWTGDLGRSLRGDPEAQAMAWYLITAPGSNMVGLYHLPIAYAAADLGSPLQGASKALRRVCGVGLAVYDEVAEVVWVKEALRHEVGESIKATDHKVKAIRKIIGEHRKSFLFNDLRERYGAGFAAVFEGIASPLQAPSKPLASPFEGSLARAKDQNQEQEQEQEQEKNPPSPQGETTPPKAKRARGRRIPPVKIPDELAAMGFTPEDFAKRVRTCNVTKKAETWQGEVDRVAEKIGEHGAVLVLELYRSTFETGYHGIPWDKLDGNGQRRLHHVTAAAGRRPEGDEDDGICF